MAADLVPKRRAMAVKLVQHIDALSEAHLQISAIKAEASGAGITFADTDFEGDDAKALGITHLTAALVNDCLDAFDYSDVVTPSLTVYFIANWQSTIDPVRSR